MIKSVCTMRIPKGYCLSNNTDGSIKRIDSGMDDTDPACNYYFYIRSYTDYLECREVRWKIINRNKKIVTKS